TTGATSSTGLATLASSSPSGSMADVDTSASAIKEAGGASSARIATRSAAKSADISSETASNAESAATLTSSTTTDDLMGSLARSQFVAPEQTAGVASERTSERSASLALTQSR